MEDGLQFRIWKPEDQRLLKRYHPCQVEAAIAEVKAGKSVSIAAKDNGVPRRSLYRKLKNLSEGKSDVFPVINIHSHGNTEGKL
jgi:hypothetical protein